MVDYREILRLQSLGHNITQIAGSLHNSRNTVREVERLADEKGIRWPLGEEVTNPQLYVLLYPERQEKANVYLEPDCAWIHRELAKKGVNLTLLWKEYQVNCSNVGRVPYQYTQFCDIYRACANSHFLRPAGPHFPASQGHIKRPVLEIGRAERVPPC